MTSDLYSWEKSDHRLILKRSEKLGAMSGVEWVSGNHPKEDWA